MVLTLRIASVMTVRSAASAAGARRSVRRSVIGFAVYLASGCSSPGHEPVRRAYACREPWLTMPRITAKMMPSIVRAITSLPIGTSRCSGLGGSSSSISSPDHAEELLADQAGDQSRRRC